MDIISGKTGEEVHSKKSESKEEESMPALSSFPHNGQVEGKCLDFARRVVLLV